MNPSQELSQLKKDKSPKEQSSFRQNLESLNRLALGLAEQDPIFFAEHFLDIKLNPFQRRALMRIAMKKQVIFATSNQVGKTLTLAIIHIWYNFYKRGFSGDPKLVHRSYYQTLNISPVSRQAKLCASYIEELLSSQFFWEIDGKRYVNKCKIEWFFQSKNENLGRIEFSNNSALYCLSTGEDQGGNLAGAQFALISYDECVQSHHLEEELSARIFSRTAKYAGAMILVSTPDDLAKSQQYWFHLYMACERGDGEWSLVKGVYDENLFIPEATREEFKRRLKKMSPTRYRQVVLGEFIAAVERMFPPEIIESLWNGKDSAVELVDRNTEFVLIIDWGVADQGDETVMIVAKADYMNPVVVDSYGKQGGDPTELMAMASYLKLQYNDAPMVLDVAEMGGVMFKKMMAIHKPISYGQGNKENALFFLQLRLRNNFRKEKGVEAAEKINLTSSEKYDTGFIKSYYLSKMENQLSAYKLDDKKLKQDWVMVLAMLCWYLERYKKSHRIKTFPLKI